MSKLNVGPDLKLPDDAITQTFVIFGKRGSGKSNTGVVLAEEMHRAGGQIIVLDPVGAWWGLKSSFDGSGPGVPVYIFGGTHGDLPLQPQAGVLMAQVAIAHRIPMILDMTGWTGADRARFVTAFAGYMLAHNDRTPVHIFLEEADAFIPQRPYKGEEAMLGAMDRLIRWGRQDGIGATAITQRAAKINKDVTTQAEVLIAHRTIGPQDVAAIREWIKYHAAGDEQAEILSTLPTLPDGEAWVWSPDWLDMLRRVRFRRRETFDSASTPKLGEARVQPKALAPVDLDSLRDKLADTVEQAKANDPAELRREIAALTAQLRERPTVAPEKVIERVEVPVIDHAAIDRFAILTHEIEDARDLLLNMARDAADDLASLRAAASRPAPVIPASVAVERPAPRSGPDRAQPEASLGTAGASPSGSLGKAERLILAALAAYPTLTREQLAFLADYHPRTAGFTNTIGALRTAGRITPGYPASITDEGAAALREAGLGPMWAPPLDEWLDRLMRSERHLLPLLGPIHPDERESWRFDAWFARQGKAERAILTPLLEAWPASVDREDLAAAAGYHPRTAGFTNTLGSLRSRELVSDFALHPDFARLIGR